MNYTAPLGAPGAIIRENLFFSWFFGFRKSKIREFVTNLSVKLVLECQQIDLNLTAHGLLAIQNKQRNLAFSVQKEGA